MKSHPEPDERELPMQRTGEAYMVLPCDSSKRQRLLDAIEAGLTLGDIARGSNVNRSIVSQYLSPDGNLYKGNIAVYEGKMIQWLDKKDLEFLAGIETVETDICGQVQAMAAAVRSQRVIGRGVGQSGIGKTRAATWLAATDALVKVYSVTAETGSREAVRSEMFRLFGIRGGKQTYGNNKLEKYRELVKRVRKADVTLIFDQAHMLSTSAMHFLCELWNETMRGQLWLGTDALYQKIDRDEQIASRVEFGDELTVTPKTLRPVLKHQITSIIPTIGHELDSLMPLCEALCGPGRLRRTEMRLKNMIYLSQDAKQQDKKWPELFQLAANFSR